MGLPSVDVVIPCFNHGRFVADAVRSALAQEGAGVRVVVVDDGSDDGWTGGACDACAGLGEGRVVVVHQANAGLPAARNRGAREALGGRAAEYLVFLDADDVLEPAFVARLAARIAGEAAAGRGGDVSHAYCQERLTGLGTGVWRVPDWDPMLLMVTNLHPVTCLVRRGCFEAAGGFDESMRGGYEDWDLWLKFAERGWRGVRVREPLFVWRRHSRETMVMRVIHDHEALYRRIMANHGALFARHALELVVLTNALMRRFDANWLDSEGRAINVEALRRAPEMYESMVAVRVQRRASRLIEGLPRPLRAAARAAVHAWKRALGYAPAPAAGAAGAGALE